MVKKRGHHAQPLVKYIDEQLKAGYSKEIIKTHLENYGYDSKTIEQSFKADKKTRINVLAKIMIFLCIGVSLFFLLWVALSTNDKFLNVLIGFSPTIICLIIAISLLEKPKHRYDLNVLWSLPIILAVIFLFMGHVSNISLLKSMEINKLASLNFMISLIFITILYLTGLLKRDVVEIIPLSKKKAEYKEEPKEEYKAQKAAKLPEKAAIESAEKELKEYLRSVEDKCKAINFAIGRVYSNKKGGSEKLRSRIKINKEWYNEISNVLKDGFDKEDKGKILSNINKIKERLESLHRSEHEIFGKEHEGLKRLNRAADGSDKILHVLIKNDKDPVKSYVDGAVEFCERVKKGL